MRCGGHAPQVGARPPHGARGVVRIGDMARGRTRARAGAPHCMHGTCAFARGKWVGGWVDGRSGAHTRHSHVAAGVSAQTRGQTQSRAVACTPLRTGALAQERKRERTRSVPAQSARDGAA